MNAQPPAAPVPTILVVDDHPANLQLLCEILHRQGLKPRPVPSGEAALRAAMAAPPDLVLLDIAMPGLDGFETLARLKANPKLADVPVIFVTAYDEISDKVRGFTAGAVDYITKPYHAEEIAARMGMHLRLRSLQRQLANENERLEHVVTERTRELAAAYEHQRELSRLKDDFLLMISHEIRTPASGILGLGDLMQELLPATEFADSLRTNFASSCTRLRELIDDATLLSSVETLKRQTGPGVQLAALVDQTQAALPQVRLHFERVPGLASSSLAGPAEYLQKALKTMVELALAFSRDKRTITLRAQDEGQVVRLHMGLDALRLSAEQAGEFFRLESSTRSRSAAEGLGLGPVVAREIIATLGGGITMSKGEGDQGDLVITLRKVPLRTA